MLYVARGTTVFASWSDTLAGESPHPIDDYILYTLAPWMLSQFQITVVLLGLNETVEAVNMVITANATGSAGVVDMIWINGNNYATLASGGLLYGPFAPLLPNAGYYDFTSAQVTADFGVPTLGYEMPYNAAQIALVYNPSMVPVPPTTFAQLLAWISANPGKFAWPIPTENSDYTAAALMRMMFAQFCPYSAYAVSPALAAPLLSSSAYTTCTAAMWANFTALSTKLYGYNAVSNTVHPPASMSVVDSLFANGTVAFSWSYDPLFAAEKVASGDWAAANVKSTLLDGAFTLRWPGCMCDSPA